MNRMNIPAGALALAFFVAAATTLAALPYNPVSGAGDDDDEAQGSMIILRGIAADYAPRGQLDDDSAIAYAEMLGFEADVLDVAADIPAGKSQVQMALDRIRADQHVTAIYGFSGGGYNAQTIWARLTPGERGRIRKVVVVGSPGVTPAAFPGSQEVVVQGDPPEGHMHGPKKLLEAAGR